MRTLLFFAFGIAILASVTTGCTHSFADSSQSSFVHSDTGSDMSSSTTNSQQSSHSSGSQSSFTSSQNTSYSSSSGYQHDSFNLDAASLKQPHILSINTSGDELTGEITVNGRVVKHIHRSKEQINLSPFLSVGKQTVAISARYAPASSSASVELSGPDTNVSQQTSGNGVLKYTMTVTVQ
jgi:hypothetical protein